MDDLVRVKTHPKSNAIANFTAKLAPVYSGPYRVSKVLSDVNHRLEKVDTGEDVGVFHVVNLQPFHSWNTALSKQKLSDYCEDGQSVDEGDSIQYGAGNSDDTALSVARLVDRTTQ